MSERTKWSSQIVICPPVLLSDVTVTDYDVIDKCLERARNSFRVQTNEELLALGAANFMFCVKQPVAGSAEETVSPIDASDIADVEIRRAIAKHLVNSLCRANGRITDSFTGKGGVIEGCLEFECRWTMPAEVGVSHV